MEKQKAGPTSISYDPAAEVAVALKSRTVLLWISTREELRVERTIAEVAATANYMVQFWDCATGLTDLTGKPIGLGIMAKDPEAAIAACQKGEERCAWIFRDLHAWLRNPTTVRALKSAARALQQRPRAEARAAIVLAPTAEIPPELLGIATLIEWPPPTRKEVESILEATVTAAAKSLELQGRTAEAITLTKNLGDPGKDKAVGAALGLSAEEVAAAYARSLVLTGNIDPTLVSTEKRRIVAQEKVLQWYEPDPRGLEAVGGYNRLKAWLRTRQLAFSSEARAYGLPEPRGVLLLGVSGCGKSLTAKAVGAAWEMPLLRLDMGALRSKWVGKSEGNLRKALRLAETISPAILWIDELEKALGGAAGPQGDGGVSSDALGTLLLWMQERKAPCFVVATCNDISSLPPELLRKGRFDEIFFIDLPTIKERQEILKTNLSLYKRDPGMFDLIRIAGACQEFNGAELASIIPEAMFLSFAEGHELQTQDLLTAAGKVVPLARTAAEKITELREWSRGRAVPASDPEITSSVPSLGRGEVFIRSPREEN